MPPHVGHTATAAVNQEKRGFGCANAERCNALVPFLCFNTDVTEWLSHPVPFRTVMIVLNRLRRQVRHMNRVVSNRRVPSLFTQKLYGLILLPSFASVCYRNWIGQELESCPTQR